MTKTKVFRYDPATVPKRTVRVCTTAATGHLTGFDPDGRAIFVTLRDYDEMRSDLSEMLGEGPIPVTPDYYDIEEPDIDVEVVPGYYAAYVDDDGEGTLTVEYEPDDEVEP